MCALSGSFVSGAATVRGHDARRLLHDPLLLHPVALSGSVVQPLAQTAVGIPGCTQPSTIASRGTPPSIRRSTMSSSVELASMMT